MNRGLVLCARSSGGGGSDFEEQNAEELRLVSIGGYGEDVIGSGGGGYACQVISEAPVSR